MKSKKLILLTFILITISLLLAGCNGTPATPTSTPVPTNTPKPVPTNTPIPTNTPLTEAIVLVSPEAMDVISSWDSKINAFTPADNPVSDLVGLTTSDIGFWNNNKLGMSLYQEVVKLLDANFGTPWEGGLWAKPKVNEAFPFVRIYFTDDSITEIDGALKVKFQSNP